MNIKKGGDKQLDDFKENLNKFQEEIQKLKEILANLEKNTSAASSQYSTQSQPVITSSPVLQENISLNGYNGTASDIISKIRTKISQLNNPSNKGKYQDKINEYKTIIANIQSATTTEEVKSAVKTITFKNNNLTGGKTKKHGRRRKHYSIKK
jgi:hypothetical protein